MKLSEEPNDEFDLNLTSGRVRVRRVGSPHAPLVLFVHGLSAHMHGFDCLVEKLANQRHQLVALDLRGRGRSEITAAGTYGLDAHCRDVLEVATLLNANRFDLVGWSMGALIGIGIANRAPERLRRLVLIDHAGRMDPAAVEKIRKGLARLDMVVERPSAYLDAIRAASGISPWSPFWDQFYQYELGPRGPGFGATTSKSACLEDLMAAENSDWPAMWKGMTMPTLLLRCSLPISGGFVVPESVRDELQRAVRQIRVEEIASDHFTVMNSEHASDAIKVFLENPG